MSNLEILTKCFENIHNANPWVASVKILLKIFKLMYFSQSYGLFNFYNRQSLLDKVSGMCTE